MGLFAIIENNVVVNVIVADEWPGGVDITSEIPQPGVGWGYVDGEFVAPPPPPQVVVTEIERSALLARMTPIEVHGWIRAAVRAQSTNTPTVADRDALYAWTRWQALPQSVELTSADIIGLANVWIALGMTPARAQQLLQPLIQ